MSGAIRYALEPVYDCIQDGKQEERARLMGLSGDTPEPVDWKLTEPLAGIPQEQIVDDVGSDPTVCQDILANKREIKSIWEWGNGIQQELDDKDDDIADLRKHLDKLKKLYQAHMKFDDMPEPNERQKGG